MENIYVYPKNNLINIEKEFLKYKLELLMDDFPETDEDIQNKLNFTGSTDEYYQLLESVSLENHLHGISDFYILNFQPNRKEKRKKQLHLQIPDSRCGSGMPTVPPRPTQLKTYDEILKYREKQIGKAMKYGSPFGPSAYSNKFTNNDINPTPLSNPTNELLIKPFSDVVISIRFYSPFTYNHGTSSYGPRFSEEFLVLGSQRLTRLRDKISCKSNNNCLFDISSNPWQDSTPKTAAASQTDPGFFFITNIFYNDTRNPNNPDYSKTILKWAAETNLKSKDIKIEKMKETSMQNSTFFDLNIRLGFPQVYQHHGNCEHLFTFSSIHLISSNDNLDQSKYPILKTVALNNIVTCNMCGTKEYSVIVTDSNRQMHDPCQLCFQCFENFHYVNGKKIGDFKAYHVNPNKTNLKIETEDLDENNLID